MKSQYSKSQRTLIAENLRFLKRFVSENLAPVLLEQLRGLTRNFSLSLKCGDLLLVGGWYVTHAQALPLLRNAGPAGSPTFRPGKESLCLQGHRLQIRTLSGVGGLRRRSI